MAGQLLTGHCKALTLLQGDDLCHGRKTDSWKCGQAATGVLLQGQCTLPLPKTVANCRCCSVSVSGWPEKIALGALLAALRVGAWGWTGGPVPGWEAQPLTTINSMSACGDSHSQSRLQSVPAFRMPSSTCGIAIFHSHRIHFNSCKVRSVESMCGSSSSSTTYITHALYSCLRRDHAYSCESTYARQ